MPASALGEVLRAELWQENPGKPLLCSLFSVGEDGTDGTYVTKQGWGLGGLFQEENDHSPEPGAFLDQGEALRDGRHDKHSESWEGPHSCGPGQWG